jgi:hypothetical protein
MGVLGDSIPELKLTLNFQVVEDIKKYILPSTIISNKDIGNEFNLTYGLMEVKISKIHINNITIDWENSHVTEFNNTPN